MAGARVEIDESWLLSYAIDWIPSDVSAVSWVLVCRVCLASSAPTLLTLLTELHCSRLHEGFAIGHSACLIRALEHIRSWRRCGSRAKCVRPPKNSRRPPSH